MRIMYINNNHGNNISYGYDIMGNREDVNESGSVTSYTNNSLNQYTDVGGTSYSYDDNGNLTDDGTYLYYYDYENRLIDVNDSNDSPIASYAYDYLGRRVSKTIHDSQTTIHYTYDGHQIIAEYDDSDTFAYDAYGQLSIR